MHTYYNIRVIRSDKNWELTLLNDALLYYGFMYKQERLINITTLDSARFKEFF